MPQRSRMVKRWARAVAVPAAGALCVLLAACGTETPIPVPTSTMTPSAAPRGDGVLTIGTLFPTTGSTSYLARAQDAGVELAIREINEAGGVNGKPVVVYHRDSGDATTKKAETSFADLVSKHVDVVIGPSSSVLAERLLPQAVDAGVALISSSATSPTLSTLPDQGLLFRTIASQATEGTALAGIIGPGKKIAVIYFLDDASRAVATQLVEGVKKEGSTPVADEVFSESINDPDKIVSSLKAVAPDAVVLISPFSGAAKTKQIIAALSKAGLAGSKLWLTGQNLSDYSQSLPAGTLTDANGILEGAEPDAGFMKRIEGADPSVTDFRYSAEAYDATILAALAAVVAGNDSGRSVADALQQVSRDGIKCRSFAECLDVLKSRPDIDYDGISGPIGFDDAGDPHPASFGLYRYGANNKYSLVNTVLAGFEN